MKSKNIFLTCIIIAGLTVTACGTRSKSVKITATKDAEEKTTEQGTREERTTEERTSAEGRAEEGTTIEEDTTTEQGTDSDKNLSIKGNIRFISDHGTNEEKVWCTGEDIKYVKSVVDKDEITGTRDYTVVIYFNDEGTKKFQEATTACMNKPIAIMLDENIISMPTVASVISDGRAVINGLGSKKAADQLEALIMGKE